MGQMGLRRGEPAKASEEESHIIIKKKNCKRATGEVSQRGLREGEPENRDRTDRDRREVRLLAPGWSSARGRATSGGAVAVEVCLFVGVKVLNCLV